MADDEGDTPAEAAQQTQREEAALVPPNPNQPPALSSASSVSNSVTSDPSTVTTQPNLPTTTAPTTSSTDTDKRQLAPPAPPAQEGVRQLYLPPLGIYLPQPIVTQGGPRPAPGPSRPQRAMRPRVIAVRGVRASRPVRPPRNRVTTTTSGPTLPVHGTGQQRLATAAPTIRFVRLPAPVKPVPNLPATVAAQVTTPQSQVQSTAAIPNTSAGVSRSSPPLIPTAAKQHQAVFTFIPTLTSDVDLLKHQAPPSTSSATTQDSATTVPTATFGVAADNGAIVFNSTQLLRARPITCMGIIAQPMPSTPATYSSTSATGTVPTSLHGGAIIHPAPFVPVTSGPLQGFRYMPIKCSGMMTDSGGLIPSVYAKIAQTGEMPLTASSAPPKPNTTLTIKQRSFTIKPVTSVGVPPSLTQPTSVHGVQSLPPALLEFVNQLARSSSGSGATQGSSVTSTATVSRGVTAQLLSSLLPNVNSTAQGRRVETVSTSSVGILSQSGLGPNLRPATANVTPSTSAITMASQLGSSRPPAPPSSVATTFGLVTPTVSSRPPVPVTTTVMSGGFAIQSGPSRPPAHPSSVATSFGLVTPTASSRSPGSVVTTLLSGGFSLQAGSSRPPVPPLSVATSLEFVIPTESNRSPMPPATPVTSGGFAPQPGHSRPPPPASTSTPTTSSHLRGAVSQPESTRPPMYIPTFVRSTPRQSVPDRPPVTQARPIDVPQMHPAIAGLFHPSGPIFYNPDVSLSPVAARHAMLGRLAAVFNPLQASPAISTASLGSVTQSLPVRPPSSTSTPSRESGPPMYIPTFVKQQQTSTAISTTSLGSATQSTPARPSASVPSTESSPPMYKPTFVKANERPVYRPPPRPSLATMLLNSFVNPPDYIIRAAAAATAAETSSPAIPLTTAAIVRKPAKRPSASLATPPTPTTSVPVSDPLVAYRPAQTITTQSLGATPITSVVPSPTSASMLAAPIQSTSRGPRNQIQFPRPTGYVRKPRGSARPRASSPRMRAPVPPAPESPTKSSRGRRGSKKQNLRLRNVETTNEDEFIDVGMTEPPPPEPSPKKTAPAPTPPPIVEPSPPPKIPFEWIKDLPTNLPVESFEYLERDIDDSEDDEINDTINLMNAGVYTAEEISRIITTKSAQLLDAYEDQFEDLKDDYKLMRSNYLRNRIKLLKSKVPFTTNPQILVRDDQHKITDDFIREEHKQYKYHQRLLQCHKNNSQRAVLHKMALQKFQEIKDKEKEAEKAAPIDPSNIENIPEADVDDSEDKSYHEFCEEVRKLKTVEHVEPPKVVARCEFAGALGNEPRCSDPALPLTKFCFTHILSSGKQHLFKPCGRKLASGSTCDIPVLGLIDKLGCQMHHMPVVRDLSEPQETKKSLEAKIHAQPKTKSRKKAVPPLEKLVVDQAVSVDHIRELIINNRVTKNDTDDSEEFEDELAGLPPGPGYMTIKF